MTKFSVSENMIMWSFRYALGRRTGAVIDVIDHLKMYWEQLRPFTQDQIQHEIRRAIEMRMAGDECDIEKWREISQLKLKEKEGA